MRVLGVLVLMGLCGFLGYSLWSSTQESGSGAVKINPDFILNSEEIVTWKPLESALNPTQLPHWKEVAEAYNAGAILDGINSSLAALNVSDELKIRLFLNQGESAFYVEGDEQDVAGLMKQFFEKEVLSIGENLSRNAAVGVSYGKSALIASSASVQEKFVSDTPDSETEVLALDENSELSWYSKSKAKRWLEFGEISAEGAALLRFKKRKGYAYAYTFINDSLMQDESLDVTYSIWDFQLPGDVTSFTIEEFPIRALDTETVVDVEEICQCDVPTAWKSWNSNQVYLFRQNGIEFYGLQCLTDLPARTGLYPFIADAAEMYKGYQIRSLISGSEVGGLYADMFGREVSYYLDLEEQVFFFSSISEAKTFINGIQNSNFDYLVGSDLQELLLLSPSFTAYDSQARGDNPVVYQYEKQDNGRYYHALWRIDDDPVTLAVTNEEDVSSGQVAPKNKWELQLEDKVVGAPFLFTNHYTKQKEIAVYTADKKISLLDSKGKLLWERQIDEELMGGLHQLDLYRNNKFQLVFSTKNQIFAIDRNGKNVDNFPVKLPSEASAPLSVMDYEGKRKYRLLVPLKDGSLVNYDKDGAQVKGWKHDKESSPLISEIIHAQIGRKDYLISGKEDGRIAIYKRDGKLRYTQDLKLSNYTGSELTLVSAKDIENVQLVYEDASQNLVKVKLSLDNNDAEILGLASGDHSLVAPLVDGSALDYLISKGNRLSLYNEAYELKFSTEFDEPIVSALQYFIKNKSTYFGFSSGRNYHLTNVRGEELEGFPLYGTGKALVRDLDKDGTVELIISDEQGLLICYELKGM
ncbi:MAG: hypothetical protein AB8B53_03990 [Flavobacteriales bacterium]